MSPEDIPSRCPVSLTCREIPPDPKEAAPIPTKHPLPPSGPAGWERDPEGFLLICRIRRPVARGVAIYSLSCCVKGIDIGSGMGTLSQRHIHRWCSRDGQTLVACGQKGKDNFVKLRTESKTT